MASQFEELLEHITLGNKLEIPADTVNINSLKTAWFRYRVGNILVTNRELRVEFNEEVDCYYVWLVPKVEKPKLQYKILARD